VMSGMIIGSEGNNDSPLSFNGAKRLGFTAAELTTIQTLSEIRTGQPTADLNYVDIFPYVAGFLNYEDMVLRDSRVFILRNYYLQHSEWDQGFVTDILEGGIQDVTISQALVSDYIKGQGIDKWDAIYANNDVTVYSNAP
jgi:hypothetical protein